MPFFHLITSVPTREVSIVRFQLSHPCFFVLLDGGCAILRFWFLCASPPIDFIPPPVTLFW